MGLGVGIVPETESGLCSLNNGTEKLGESVDEAEAILEGIWEVLKKAKTFWGLGLFWKR